MNDYRRRIGPVAALSRPVEPADLPWRKRLAGEPTLKELLADPIMDLLLQSDRVTPAALYGAIASSQALLRCHPIRSIPWAAGAFG